MWHSQDRQHNRHSAPKSATSIDMSRAGSVTLGARTVVEQSSFVNETYFLTPKSLVYNTRLVKKILGRVGSRRSIQDQVGVAENNVWDHFGVAKRKWLGTTDITAHITKSEQKILTEQFKTGMH